MNDHSRLEALRELAWRRPLTDAERAELRAWLADHPEAQPDCAIEAQLTAALRGLADVPVASNFTARVLQAVARDAGERAAPRDPAWRLWWRSTGWAPKTAFAAVVLGLGVFCVHSYQAAARHRLAESVAAFSEASARLSPEVLQDFEPIRRLPPAPVADEKLLIVLQ
jgi:anti-sigma factor RsiW